jgi:hypothetical protein
MLAPTFFEFQGGVIMFRRYLILKTAILVALFLAFVYVAPAQNRAVLAKAQSVTGDRFTVAVKTPRGANVYAVKRPNGQMLNAIDRGLTDLFAVARKNRYNKRLRYSDYSIFIGRADRTKDSRG